ncbi:MAG: aspartate--ammonia ligase [Bacteroidetes bacterium HGW-Bacteroidetes-17]|nr:MAG: aspartate--ammonia ligase [Bacteroidetes bacterium HGW-Bacteroidetes-17]
MKTDFLKTEQSISFVKETFEKLLLKQLDLYKISAPLMVLDGTGINDDLNGIERVVEFPIKALQEQKAVIVNSLAKWKRLRLKELGVEADKGILTDMRAIRPDEDFSSIHSIYVDQWDWEKHLTSEQRSLSTLKSEVMKIYEAIKKTELLVQEKYPEHKAILPDQITFIHAEELLALYPALTPRERESEIIKKHKAVFIIGIGGKLSSGEVHDGRAPDYDDWTTSTVNGFKGLNGDIIVWHPELKSAFELSSMGIRVDKDALVKQLEISGKSSRKELFFHQQILNDKLTQSIGGGIGQSRLCMFMLKRKHIGEVQVSLWPESIRNNMKNQGVFLM